MPSMVACPARGATPRRCLRCPGWTRRQTASLAACPTRGARQTPSPACACSTSTTTRCRVRGLTEGVVVVGCGGGGGHPQLSWLRAPCCPLPSCAVLRCAVLAPCRKVSSLMTPRPHPCPQARCPRSGASTPPCSSSSPGAGGTLSESVVWARLLTVASCPLCCASLHCPATTPWPTACPPADCISARRPALHVVLPPIPNPNPLLPPSCRSLAHNNLTGSLPDSWGTVANSLAALYVLVSAAPPPPTSDPPTPTPHTHPGPRTPHTLRVHCAPTAAPPTGCIASAVVCACEVCLRRSRLRRGRANAALRPPVPSPPHPAHRRVHHTDASTPPHPPTHRKQPRTCPTTGSTAACPPAGAPSPRPSPPSPPPPSPATTLTARSQKTGASCRPYNTCE